MQLKEANELEMKLDWSENFLTMNAGSCEAINDHFIHTVRLIVTNLAVPSSLQARYLPGQKARTC